MRKKAENITAGKQYGGTRLNLKFGKFCEICLESRYFGFSLHHIAYQQNVSRHSKNRYLRRKLFRL